jgi:hypothetical protein
MTGCGERGHCPRATLAPGVCPCFFVRSGVDWPVGRLQALEASMGRPLAAALAAASRYGITKLVFWTSSQRNSPPPWATSTSRSGALALCKDCRPVLDVIAHNDVPKRDSGSGSWHRSPRRPSGRRPADAAHPLVVQAAVAAHHLQHLLGHTLPRPDRLRHASASATRCGGTIRSPAQVDEPRGSFG